MKELTVLYDASCGICRNCREWVEEQERFFPIHFVPLQDPHLEERFPGIGTYRPVEQMLAIGEGGALYQGADAWIMVLYALKGYRELSLRLSHPALKPLARKSYELVSKNRHAMSGLLGLKGEQAEMAFKEVIDEVPSDRFICQCDQDCGCGIEK